MLSVTTKIKSLWARLANKDYRTSYLDEAINSRLAAQIHALRVSRGLTQHDVSALTGIAQPTLSRMESDSNGITTTTLKRLANAYDVALSIKFVGFCEFAEEVAASKVDLDIPEFSKDSVPAALVLSAAMISSEEIGKYKNRITVPSASAVRCSYGRLRTTAGPTLPTGGEKMHA
jgi:transcriptional regulator with XRE-family HTH domain